MKKLTFEDSINRLTNIVSALEKDDLSLDESLKLYEEGAKLAHSCYSILEKAEQKVKIIEESAGEGQ
jgi:exodeoxyribonuclease VII small subunit